MRHQPDNDTILKRETVSREPCDVPFSHLDWFSKCVDKTEVTRTWQSSLLDSSYPVLYRFLEIYAKSKKYKKIGIIFL